MKQKTVINALTLNRLHDNIKPGKWYLDKKRNQKCLVLMRWLDGRLEVWAPPEHMFKFPLTHKPLIS